MSFLSEYQAELHSHLRATSQSHTPATLELPLREFYSVLNVSDVLEYSRKSYGPDRPLDLQTTNLKVFRLSSY